MMKSNLLIFLMALFICACSQKEKVDLFVYNATIYTVDSSFSTAEAMAIKDGKIVETGKKVELEEKYNAKEKLDAGATLMQVWTGFIYEGPSIVKHICSYLSKNK